jgi:hypothetical protein
MAIDLNKSPDEQNADPLPDLHMMRSIPTTMAIDLNTKLDDENGDPLPDLNEKHADDQGLEIHPPEAVHL